MDVVDAKGGVDAAVGVKHTVAIEEVEAVEVAGSLLSALPSDLRWGSKAVAVVVVVAPPLWWCTGDGCAGTPG